ncbi:MAG: hypothetical protein P9L94_02715 [Candidatus Hinthialibacter antarcticus]|nr:hypothetical protein [Candidatus Hinthialibacter antarcticus]
MNTFVKHLRFMAIAGALALPATAQDFEFSVNDLNYPTPTITIGQDFVIEAEQALLIFDEGVEFTPEEVYQVNANPAASGGAEVQFIGTSNQGRFNNWSLTFPFILTEETHVQLIYGIRFFTGEGGEGKAYVKMDNNEDDFWPSTFFGLEEDLWAEADFPEGDGGGWIQINNFSNKQRKTYGEFWGDNLDFRAIWAEGNWFGKQPEVEILAWTLPAGQHTFQMTPRSGGTLALDYVAIITSEFDRFQFDFIPADAQKLETSVESFMLY